MSTSGADPELSVVLPALNEEASIGAVAGGLFACARRLGISCEVLVVDGFSADETVKRAESAGAKVLKEADGFACAVRRGIAAARGKYILTMDADGSHSPEEFPGLWARREDAELVIGSRFVEGGGVEMPYHRLLLSRILNRFFRAAFGIAVGDGSSGYRLYHASAIQGLGGSSVNFEFQQETLLAILRGGGRVCEAPAHYLWRVEGVSKASVLKSGVGYLRVLSRFWGPLAGA